MGDEMYLGYLRAFGAEPSTEEFWINPIGLKKEYYNTEIKLCVNPLKK